MPPVTYPRRVTSTATTITVTSLPSWLPGAGQFGSISLSDASAINPSAIDPRYPGLWVGNSGGWNAVWDAYGGGAYAPTLGAYGSILLFNGGHRTWGGCNVVRYDIETRVWSNYTYPIHAATDRSISGGVVVSTPSGDTGSVNDRVGLAGHYIKTADGVAIAGTEATGNSTTTWYPFPIHTNCGITFVPPDAGGGTLGSLVVVGHNQTGLHILSANGRIFRLDLATKVWSAIPFNFSQYFSPHGCEYDSFNKVLWVIRGDNSPLYAYNYQTGVGHALSSPALNSTGDYPNLCFMASRKLLIRATSRWNGSASEPALMAIDVSKYVHGSTTTLSSYVLNMTAYPTGWPTSLKNGIYSGCKDKLDYCDLDGNVYYLERQAPGGTSCTLWKLVPPAVGQEQSGTWSWRAETINIKAGDSYGSFACGGAAREPSWGGRARYVPALKAIVLTDKYNWPVQAVRSGSWV